MASPLAHLDRKLLRQKTWPWWHPDIGDKLTPKARKILEDCGVAPENVEAHVCQVRDLAWDVFPFPCIGEFYFVEFGLARHPYFQEAVTYLNQLSTGPTPPSLPARIPAASDANQVVENILQHRTHPRLLDIGTCLGQDLRLFHHNGVPCALLYGTDIFPSFESIAHNLFLDTLSFPSHFFPSDIFDDNPSSPLNSTAGMWDVVTASMFTHQFDLDQQKAIAKRMIQLLKGRKGSVVLGSSTGQVEPAAIPLRPPFCEKIGDTMIYRQSKETMRELWEGAIRGCGEDVKGWEVVCEYDEEEVRRREREEREKGQVRFFQGGGQRRIHFWVRRVVEVEV